MGQVGHPIILYNCYNVLGSLHHLYHAPGYPQGPTDIGVSPAVAGGGNVFYTQK